MNAILSFILRMILILLAYIFIGWVSFAVFKDLKQQAFGYREGQVPALTLVPTAGQQMQEKQFTSPEIIIGRDPTCDFILDDETVSLRHCKLFFERKQWWVEDMDSTNGSFLNESEIKTRTILINNDELRLGQVTLTIKLDK